MDAWQVMQIAAAVFLGNVMTLGLFKGWQRMKAEDGFSFTTAFYWLAPLCLALVVLTTSG